MAERILVMGHVQPDGDCVSSALAIAEYYRSGGIPARVFFPELLSPTLMWMVGEVPAIATTIDVRDALKWEPDRLIVVDCAPTKARTGFPIEEYMESHKTVKILNIDHHADRLKDKPLPYENRIEKVIHPDVSSTAEILVSLEDVDCPILYVGLATDTLFFKVGQVHSAMQAAIDLHLKDSIITKFRNKLDVKYDIKQVMQIVGSEVGHYVGLGYNLYIVKIPAIDGELNITFINITRGFDFVAIIQANGSCSLRTAREYVDLSVFAKKFKGGGHPQASGCKVDMENIDDFISEYRKFIEEVINK